MEVNNNIAQAPKVSLETLAILCANASHRWEWRSLSHAYQAALKPISDYSVIFKNKPINDMRENAISISTEYKEKISTITMIALSISSK